MRRGSEVSLYLGLREPSHVLSTGCTRSTDAIGYAYYMVRFGLAEQLITDGVDATITHGVMQGFCVMRVVSGSGYLPPAINYEDSDPACDLNYIPNRGICRSVEIALCNRIGFGSKYSALAQVIEPVTGEGVYFATASGLIAARTIDEAFQRGDFSAARLSEYERTFRRALWRRRNRSRFIQDPIYRPAFLRSLVRFSSKQRKRLGSLVNSICLPDQSRFSTAALNPS